MYSKTDKVMKAKDYEVVLCNNGFLYINEDDGNDAISKDSKRLSEKDLKEIKNWIDKNHEYVRIDDFIKKAAFWLECNLSDRPMEDRKFWVEDFVNYMKGE